MSDTPSSSSGPARWVISLLAPDRIGILKALTSAVSDLSGNIDGMSQTVIHGYFTVILTVTFDNSSSQEQIREAVQNNFAPGEVSVVIRPYRDSPPPAREARTERYILTLTGKDRPGILKLVTGYLADSHINIEDYYFTIQGEDVTHIGELSVPVDTDIKQMQKELQFLVSSIGLVATLQHEFLFRAANDIFCIRQLFKMEPCEK